MNIINLDAGMKIIIAVLLLLSGAIIWHLLFSFARYIKLRFRFKKGKKGEIIARKYLKRNGFTIISEQVSRTALMLVDGTGYEYDVRVDFLVQKRGETGIVEVKTGHIAVNPVSVQTRRQLFEYYHLFCVDFLLFFNADKRELQEIVFKAAE